MPQWIGLAIVAAGSIWGFAVLWGRFSERMDFLKGEIIELQQLAQTPGEREALAAVLDARFTAHEKQDDLRFDNLVRLIGGFENKLDKILIAVNGNKRERQ